MAEKKKKKLWKGLKAVSNLVMNGSYEKPDTDKEYIQSPSDAQTMDVQSGYGTYIDPITGQMKKILDYAAWLSALPGKAPPDRLSQYALIEQLIQTDDFHKCLEYIQIRACSTSLDTGLKIHIDPDNDAEPTDKNYEEARQMIAVWNLDKHIADWISKTSNFGIKVVLPLKEQGIGVTGIFDDERLHPKYIQGYKWFDPERKEVRVGYVFPQFQKPEDGQGMRIFQEDDVVIFKRKKAVARSAEVQQPIKGSKDFQKENFDMWDQKTWSGKYPLTDYGHSIVIVAYEAFVSLARIRQAVEKARLRTEKEIAIVGVPTDGLDPVKAQEHSDGYAKIFNQVYNKGRDAISSLVHVVSIPYNALKQKIDVTFNRVDPNITGLTDLEKAEARFTSALGLDASVIAGKAGEIGGLGGAGLMDATTAEAAQMSKDSNAAGVEGVEEILRIHFLSKYGLVFTKDNKPYKVRIHTGDTSAEKERLLLEESRQMQVNQVAQRIVMLADFVDVDMVEAMVRADVKYLKVPEEEARKIYKEKPPPPPGQEEGAF